MKILFNITFFTLLVIFSASCKQEEPKKMKGMVNVGSIEIWCDESIKKIIDQQLDVYQTSYKDTDIKIHYAPESYVKALFYKDSTDVIVISSQIDTADVRKFNEKSVYPRQYKFATSALAFIVQKGSKYENFSQEELTSRLKGDKTDIGFIIENANSGIANALTTILDNKPLGKNVFAKANKKEVIEWVNKDPNAIGIIDWSEISDSDDPEAKAILEQIKLVGISTPRSKGEFFKPYQYNLYGDYPFTRDLYLIRRSGKTDVSLGFASFICSERGQKIVLKAGLLPTYQTERIIELKPVSDIKIVK